MTFHADFWVVAGTAAPIIALSSILVNGDQIQVGIDLERATGKVRADIPFRKWPSEYYPIFFWYIVTVVIDLFQAITLFVSLMSLAQESNFLSPAFVAVAELFSLVFLTASTLRTIQYKDWAMRLDQEKHSLSLSSKRLRHPSRKAQSNAFRRANRYRSSHHINNARSARRGPQPRKQFLGRWLMHSILW
jgi:hypothetical protein